MPVSLSVEYEPARHHSLEGLSATELRAMALCGEAVRLAIGIAELYLPADAEIGREQRAALLAAYARPSLVLVSSTAAWLLAGGPVPDRIEVSTRRGRFRPRPMLVRRRQRLGPDDWMHIASVAVTTPERTYRDLRDEGSEDTARRLLRRCPELAHLREHAT